MIRKASDLFHVSKLAQAMITNTVQYPPFMQPYTEQLNKLHKRMQQSAEVGETKLYIQNLPQPIRTYLQDNGFVVDMTRISWEEGKVQPKTVLDAGVQVAIDVYAQVFFVGDPNAQK